MLSRATSQAATTGVPRNPAHIEQQAPKTLSAVFFCFLRMTGFWCSAAMATMGGRSIRRLGNGFVLYGLISAVFTINAFAVHTQLFRFKFPAKFMKIDAHSSFQ